MLDVALIVWLLGTVLFGHLFYLFMGPLDDAREARTWALGSVIWPVVVVEVLLCFAYYAVEDFLAWMRRR